MDNDTKDADEIRNIIEFIFSLDKNNSKDNDNIIIQLEEAITTGINNNNVYLGQTFPKEE
jgi:hypothetical protein